MNYAEIIDLDRYPMADLSSPEGRALVADCRAAMERDGLCLLPGFLRSESLDRMVSEAQALLPQAHYTEHWRASAHGSGTDEAGTIARATRASTSAIAYDQLAADSALRSLYEWDGFTDFIAAVLGQSPLYRCADPMVSCMLAACGANDELGWHYDPNDGVVSLLLQAAEAGGAFEFAPGIRFAGEQANDLEVAVLDERYKELVRPALAPGTLSMFNGHGALHRVTPVTGERERIIALFSYTAEPGYIFSEDVQRNFFGRTV